MSRFVQPFFLIKNEVSLSTHIVLLSCTLSCQRHLCIFSIRSASDGAHLGPGALDTAEWKSIASNVERKHISLYR